MKMESPSYIGWIPSFAGMTGVDAYASDDFFVD
jgi:hypothetical protein